MARLALSLAFLLILATACSTPAPAPTAAPSQPTAAPAAAAPAAAPTAVPAKPTDVPAKKVDFPVKGRSIQLINPFAAGGASGVGSRLLAVEMEKELGVPVEVVDKAGAGSQIGTTDIAQAKPDGYTWGMIGVPTVNTLYLNPDRQAIFKRTSFQSIGGHIRDAGLIAVTADSPYKELKDLVAAAKANPEKIKASTTGILGANHLSVLQIQRQAGVKFAIVHFDGGGPASTALLGGHTDIYFGFTADLYKYIVGGQMRALAVMGKTGTDFLPGVTTAASQGYPLDWSLSRTVVVPAATPKEIVDVLSAAMKKVTNTPEHKQKIKDAGIEPAYMAPEDFMKLWADYDVVVDPLLKEALLEQK